MASQKQPIIPQIVDMDDPQLLTHLISLAGTKPDLAGSLAQDLLDAHQSLERILSLPNQTLLDFPQLGESAAAFLLLLSALTKRYLAGPPVDEAVEPEKGRSWGREEIETYVLPHFQDQLHERVCLFCLGEHLELQTASLLTQGGTAAVSCSVSRVLQLALTHHSKSVILAHNHPDGTADFSKSDLLATSVVAFALSSVGVALADHLLLAGDEVVSLRGLFSAGQVSDLPCSPPEAWKDQTWSVPRIRVQLPKEFKGPTSHR